jgi:hypothetical protein
MPTHCSQEELDFGSCGGRKLVGALLTERLARAFRDLRLADGIPTPSPISCASASSGSRSATRT